MTLLDDWLAQADGRAAFDDWHFAMLLLEHSSPSEVAAIAGVFPQGEALAERFDGFFASHRVGMSLGALPHVFPAKENAREPIELVGLMSRHIRGVGAYLEAVGDAELAAEVPREVWAVSREEVEEALDNYVFLPHAAIQDAVGDAFSRRFVEPRALCFTLREAAYHLTLDADVTRYLLAPINLLPLSFDDLYAFWRAGGFYAIASEAVLIAPR